MGSTISSNKPSDLQKRWYTTLIPQGNLDKYTIFNYYKNVKNKILPHIKDKELIVKQIFTPDYTVLKRWADNKKITITHLNDVNSPQSFDYWIERRAAEFHPTLNKTQTDQIVVDLDSHGATIEEMKQYAKKVKEILAKLPDVRDVEIQFSGGSGFYVIGKLAKSQNVNQLRHTIRDILDREFANDPDVTTSVFYPKKVVLDLSPNKVGGSYRAPYSLNLQTGLVAIPVHDINKFDLNIANPLNYIKRFYIPQR
ncbi:MAG: hypothetical protein ACP5JE_04610, partial [Thermoplasmata archaeon]